jgi:hypothetical protein
MFSIIQCDLPADALLRTYGGGPHPERWAGQGDCFCVNVRGDVRVADFVFAFYTSPAFRMERWILGVFAGAKSTDAEARALADGLGESFAIWRVGERTTTQLLMCDRYEKTRSWFRVMRLQNGGTSLQFGSAVATRRDGRTGVARVGTGFRLLMGFHVVYSRLLLWSAKRLIADNS